MIAPPVSAGDHFVFYGLLKQGMQGGPKGVDLERHGGQQLRLQHDRQDARHVGCSQPRGFS